MIESVEFWRIFSFLFFVTAIPVAIIIVLEKRSPFKTIAWILVLILLPIIGVIFYLFFGQEYRKRKLFSRKGIRSLGKFKMLAENQLLELTQNEYDLSKVLIENNNIIRLLLNNSNALLTTGNELQILNNGPQTFEAITSAIKNARHHIHLDYYIFSEDKIGQEIKNLLIEKSLEGVEVRIIVDDVGSWGLRKRFFEELKENGIEIYSFMEVRFPRLTSRLNFRNHRKIIIVDGIIGFTGGINIADRYIEGLDKNTPWRDTHLQIKGDAVSCLQAIFAADWFFVINENLEGVKYFPKFRNSNGVSVQISTSGPDSDWENIKQAFFLAITNAKKSVYITTPYFMPPQPIITALKSIALSNIDVRIIIPEISDSTTSKWCSFSYVEELLEAGVRFYFYQTGFIHSKILIVDHNLSSIGTTNFDFRSLETNFEVNAFIYNERFNNEMKEQFYSDLGDSREILLSDWKNRPWHFKVRESFAHIVSPMF